MGDHGRVPPTLHLDESLSIGELAQVARDGRPVELSAAARERIARGREVTERLLAE